VANTLTTTPPRQLEWHYLCTKFYEILPTGSKIISEGTYRQPGDLISLLSFLENRLKVQKSATKQHMCIKMKIIILCLITKAVKS
jgi:hypothetical protein